MAARKIADRTSCGRFSAAGLVFGSGLFKIVLVVVVVWYSSGWAYFRPEATIVN